MVDPYRNLFEMDPESKKERSAARMRDIALSKLQERLKIVLEKIEMAARKGCFSCIVKGSRKFIQQLVDQFDYSVEKRFSLDDERQEIDWIVTW